MDAVELGVLGSVDMASSDYWDHDTAERYDESSGFMFTCDLMAQLAGLDSVSRAADWRGNDFTGDSESHVSAWRKPIR